MDNLNIFLPLVDGSLMDINEGWESGKEIIHDLISDDFGPPPNRLCIEVTTESGKKVCIHVPYDESSNASVTIDGDNIA